MPSWPFGDAISALPPAPAPGVPTAPAPPTGIISASGSGARASLVGAGTLLVGNASGAVRSQARRLAAAKSNGANARACKLRASMAVTQPVVSNARHRDSPSLRGAPWALRRDPR